MRATISRRAVRLFLSTLTPKPFRGLEGFCRSCTNLFQKSSEPTDSESGRYYSLTARRGQHPMNSPAIASLSLKCLPILPLRNSKYSLLATVPHEPLNLNSFELLLGVFFLLPNYSLVSTLFRARKTSSNSHSSGLIYSQLPSHEVKFRTPIEVMQQLAKYSCHKSCHEFLAPNNRTGRRSALRRLSGLLYKGGNAMMVHMVSTGRPLLYVTLWSS